MDGSFNLLRYSLFLVFITGSLLCHGQYFGRNKVNYHNFPFKVVHTPHFHIHTYLADTSAQKRFAQRTEHWYRIHQSIFRDTFKEPNPFILYNTHAHFQQTRAISGLIDVSTGGVTEGLKNRVVMPLMESHAQTDHVLGHELVHAFQYSLLKKADSLSFARVLGNLPLWMVEGLAEYMSIGYVDALTALWLRSAVEANKLPSLKDLTNKPYEYFPYRWGHAFWAYVTGVWGDQVIRPLFMETATSGYKDAVKKVLGLEEKVFSEKWKQAIQSAYAAFRPLAQTRTPGRTLIDNKNGGRINVVPSLSPDGKWLAFWTEKDPLSFDLYLANATTGKVVRKVTTGRFDAHIDNYSSYESSIAWSPDSRQFAYVAFAKGKNQLIIADIENRKRQKQIDIPVLDGFSSPVWSPNGKSIVVTGVSQGQSDLYEYDLEKKRLQAITSDIYSDLQPSFSSDGKLIVFSTDRGSLENNLVSHQFNHRLALLERSTGQVKLLNVFSNANNFNPLFSAGDSTLYFLSDRDGFRNLYAYNLHSDRVTQLTRLFTGITGITIFSPAMSISSTGKLVYTSFHDGKYSIHLAEAVDLTALDVEKDTTDMRAAIIPSHGDRKDQVVQDHLGSQFSLIPDTSLTISPYQPKLQLDYLSNTGTGISVGRYGTGMAGAVNSLFSDMLGNHQLFGALSVNGRLIDAAGQFVYFNQKRRINWGIGFSHIPYYSGASWIGFDSLNSGNKKIPAVSHNTDILRIFEEQFSLLGTWPFSQTRRLEMGGSYSMYHENLERFTTYYDSLGYPVGFDHKKDLPAGESFNAGNFYMAWVGDNSQFGITSPLKGKRFRIEVAKYFGDLDAWQLVADYRRYFRMAPFTMAARNIFYGRFGKGVESGLFPPLYIGYPWLIRGYENSSFTSNSGPLLVNEMSGNWMNVANAELRLPLTGPERLSVIRSRILFTELSLFADGGTAWDKNKSSKWIMSSGVSLRVNLFGYLIIEPYYAVPWQIGGWRNASMGLNLLPGW
jgi:Tol biopolymer transport system component